MDEFLTVEKQGGLLQISLKDHWVFDNLNTLQQNLDEIEPGTENRRPVCLWWPQGFRPRRSLGPVRKIHGFRRIGHRDRIRSGFKATHFKFLQHIIDIAAQKEYIPGFFDPQPRHYWRNGIRKIGENTIEAVDSVGYIARSVLDGIKRPSRLVVGETIHQVHAPGRLPYRS